MTAQPYTPRPWTEEETNILCDMVADDMGFGTAAKKLGRTKNGCISKFRKIARALGEHFA